MARIIICDPDIYGHGLDMRTAFINAYILAGGDEETIKADIEFYPSNAYVELYNEIINGSYPDCEMILYSYSGIAGYVNYAKTLYRDYGILTCMPLGSNLFAELPAFGTYGASGTTPDPRVIVTVGAGDEELKNNTAWGNGIEFWDWDITQTDPPSSDQSSYSNGTIAGKLMYIKDYWTAQGEERDWWDVRWVARKTADRTEPNRSADSTITTVTWCRYNGFGRINVADALTGYTTPPDDPYLLGGNIVTMGQLTISVAHTTTHADLLLLLATSSTATLDDGDTVTVAVNAYTSIYKFSGGAWSSPFGQTNEEFWNTRTTEAELWKYEATLILPTGVTNTSNVKLVTLISKLVSTAPAPSPSAAAGTAVIVNGKIMGVTITNQGSGYTSTPTVGFVTTSGQAEALAIAYPNSLTYSSTSITGLPVKYYNAVALYAAIQYKIREASEILKSTLASIDFEQSIPPIAPSAPSYSFTPVNYTDASYSDASYTSAIYTAALISTIAETTIENAEVAPTYAISTMSLLPALSDLTISVSPPEEPSAITYTDAVEGTTDPLIVFTDAVPEFVQPVSTVDWTNLKAFLHTDEDIEKANSEINHQQAKIQEYQSNIAGASSVFGNEIEAYKAKLSKAIKEAEIKLGIYKTETDLNSLNAAKSLEAAISNLQVYKSKVEAYAVQVNTQVNVYQANIAKWKALLDGNLTKYQLDIQNQFNDFQRQNEIYKSVIAKEIETAKLAQERLVKQTEIQVQLNMNNAKAQIDTLLMNAQKSADVDAMNKAKTMEKDIINKAKTLEKEIINSSKALEAEITEYRSKLEKYQVEMVAYQNAIQEESQRVQTMIQKNLGQYESTLKLIETLKREFNEIIGGQSGK
jgi:hypothetical protein